MSNQLSVFIPTIYSGYDEHDIKAIFAKNVGRVSKVEFTKARVQGSENRTRYVRNTYVRSAYVFFAFFYNNRLTNLITNKAIHSNSGLKYIVSSHEHWILLQNFKAVPRGKTIHHLEQEIQHAQEIINNLQDEIRHLYNKLSEQSATITTLHKSYDTLHTNYCNTTLELNRTNEVANVLLYDEENGLTMTEIVGHTNYMKYGKHYNRRLLLNREDDGDTINRDKRNTTITDETSTIVSELDLNSGDEIDTDFNDSEIDGDSTSTYNYNSEDDEDDEDDEEADKADKEDEELIRTYIREHIRPELFGRTVEEEMKNYKKH